MKTRLDQKEQQIRRLGLSGPTRSIGMNRRSLTGRVSVDGVGRAQFESSLERDWILCLDFDPAVQLVLEQPFTISYPSALGPTRYTPDVLAEYVVGNQASVVVYEVKHRDDLRAEWSKYRQRFAKAVSYCRERGWRFKIVTETHIRTPYLQNVKFLRRYRGLDEQTTFKDQLLYSMRSLGPTTPQALLAYAYLHEEKRMAALTELWRLVATRCVVTDLQQPLTMRSPLSLGSLE